MRAEHTVDKAIDTLGMRLVKKSVNQDDPGTYHLTYGAAFGREGAAVG